MSRERLKIEPHPSWLLVFAVSIPVFSHFLQEQGTRKDGAEVLALLMSFGLFLSGFYGVRKLRERRKFGRQNPKHREIWRRGETNCTLADSLNAAEHLLAREAPFRGAPWPIGLKTSWDETGLACKDGNFVAWSEISCAEIEFRRDQYGVYAPLRVQLFRGDERVFATNFRWTSEENIAAFLRDLRAVFAVEIALN